MLTEENNISEQLDYITKIAEIDKQLFKLARLKSDLPGEIEAMKVEEQNLLSEQKEIGDKIVKEKNFIQNENKDIVEKKSLLDSLEQQKSTISNSKEYASISKAMELNSLEVQLSEKKIRNANASIEVLNNKLSELNSLIENMSIVLKSKVNDLENLLKSSEIEVKDFEKLRVEIVSKVPKNVISRYDRVRGVNKSGMGASYIERGACGVCFMVIPAQQQIDVSVCREQNQIHRCDYCGAILLGVSFENIEQYMSVSLVRPSISEDDQTFSSKNV